MENNERPVPPTTSQEAQVAQPSSTPVENVDVTSSQTTASPSYSAYAAESFHRPTTYATDSVPEGLHHKEDL